MDAKGRDEPKNRRREETLARRVGEALHKMNPSGTGECPDAEVIAAYSDHGLALDETARWDSHFATCARCRKILRVLAASADTPLAENEVARLGELVAAAHVPTDATAKPAKIARPGAWDWRVRWLAPALENHGAPRDDPDCAGTQGTGASRVVGVKGAASNWSPARR